MYIAAINKIYLSLLLLVLRQMGANQSKSEGPDEKVFQNEIPISVWYLVCCCLVNSVTN